MLIKISLFGKPEKCFIFRNNKNIDLNELVLKDLQLDDKVVYRSLIQTDESENLFVKVTGSKYGTNNEVSRGFRPTLNKPNKFKFIVREIIAERLLLTMRSLKEYRDSKKLASIGVKTSEVYGAGFFVSNMNTYNGIIIYKKLENLISAQEVLLSEESAEIKEILLEKVQHDYLKMARHKLHFRDLHMSNVLFDPKTHDIYWIDASLSKLARF